MRGGPGGAGPGQTEITFNVIFQPYLEQESGPVGLHGDPGEEAEGGGERSLWNRKKEEGGRKEGAEKQRRAYMKPTTKPLKTWQRRTTSGNLWERPFGRRRGMGSQIVRLVRPRSLERGEVGGNQVSPSPSFLAGPPTSVSRGVANV